MKLIQLTDDLVEELIEFIAQETRRGTPAKEIAATVEIILDREAQKTIEEGLNSRGRVFKSYREAEAHLKSV